MRIIVCLLSHVSVIKPPEVLYKCDASLLFVPAPVQFVNWTDYINMGGCNHEHVIQFPLFGDNRLPVFTSKEIMTL